MVEKVVLLIAGNGPGSAVPANTTFSTSAITAHPGPPSPTTSQSIATPSRPPVIVVSFPPTFEYLGNCLHLGFPFLYKHHRSRYLTYLPPHTTNSTLQSHPSKYFACRYKGQFSGTQALAIKNSLHQNHDLANRLQPRALARHCMAT